MKEIGGEFGVRGWVVIAGVLDNAFPYGEGKVESAVGCVTLLEVLDDTEGMEVVVEAEAMLL